MNQYPDYLRVHNVDDNSPNPAFTISNIDTVAEQLGQATGWQFDFVENRKSIQNRSTPKSVDASAEWHFEIVDMLVETPANQRLHRDRATEIADATNALVKQLDSAQRKIRELHAELATHIPVVVKPGDEASQHLDQLLRSAADVVGSNRAALYMLDDATTSLNMRAEIGLGKIDTESRCLENATADLEALVGYAVVVDDSHQQQIWKVPVECAAAICVPVSSLETPLGTLWIFLDQPQDCSSTQINSIEIIAGRIASELQLQAMKRQMLTSKNSSPNDSDRNTLLRRQPTIAPPLDHLEVTSLKPQSSDGESIVADWSFNEIGDMILMSATIEGAPHPSASIAAAAQAAFCALRNRVNSSVELVSEIVNVISRLEPEIVQGELTVAIVDCDHCTIETASISGALHIGDEDDFVISAHQALGQIGQSAWIGDGWKITRR